MRWVREAIDSWRWRDKGQLQLRVGYPSTSLVAAIDLVDRGRDARTSDDFKRAEEERERQRREAESDR